VQTTQRKPRPAWHHPRTTDDPEKVVKLGFQVLHSERVALQKLAATHGYTLKDFLLEGAERMRADLERETRRGHGQR